MFQSYINKFKYILNPLSVLCAKVTSLDMPSFDMLCNLAYVENVSTSDFLKVQLEF